MEDNQMPKLDDFLYDEASSNNRLPMYYELLALEQVGVIENPEDFECPVCLESIAKGLGIILRDCLHSICKQCLSEIVNTTEDVVIKCPFGGCDGIIQDRELYPAVPEEIIEKYQRRSIKYAEQRINDSFHCQTPNCDGWAIIESGVEFLCPICGANNCIPCKGIHTEMDCKTFRDLRDAVNDTDGSNGYLTARKLENIIQTESSILCPQCRVLIVRESGCDGVTCAACKVAICWATKGLRWGPKGAGDQSGGCHCMVNNVKCTPTCKNCH